MNIVLGRASARQTAPPRRPARVLPLRPGQLPAEPPFAVHPGLEHVSTIVPRVIAAILDRAANRPSAGHSQAAAELLEELAREAIPDANDRGVTQELRRLRASLRQTGAA